MRRGLINLGSGPSEGWGLTELGWDAGMTQAFRKP